jgi:hypothetical protein
MGMVAEGVGESGPGCKEFPLSLECWLSNLLEDTEAKQGSGQGI